MLVYTLIGLATGSYAALQVIFRHCLDKGYSSLAATQRATKR
jgi:hypothetical protein